MRLAIIIYSIMQINAVVCYTSSLQMYAYIYIICLLVGYSYNCMNLFVRTYVFAVWLRLAVRSKMDQMQLSSSIEVFLSLSLWKLLCSAYEFSYINHSCSYTYINDALYFYFYSSVALAAHNTTRRVLKNVHVLITRFLRT